MAAPSTKQKLLSSIEDVEIITKELFELVGSPKQQKLDGVDTGQLIELLVQKDKDIQGLLKIAKQQGIEQQKMDSLQQEVTKRDEYIKELQKNLKEAESVLATAIYQAKQKLSSINQAEKKRISSEELIKYAHKISASNAVAAPPTWAPGDVRRPYPTDMDMRSGLLGRMSDLPPGQAFHEPMAAAARGTLEQSLSNTSGGSSPSMTWQAGAMDIHHRSTEHHFPSADHKGQDDVEMMSSDSSSSSSSDE